MKNKRIILPGIVCTVLMLAVIPLVVACSKPAPAPAPTPAPAPAPAPTPKPAVPIKIKAITFTAHLTPTDMWSSFGILMNAINERAKGELVIECIGGPEAIAVKDQPEALKKGVVDMLMIAASLNASFVPAGELLSLSTIPTAEERKSAVSDLLREEHKKANMFYLGRVPTDDMVYSLLLRKQRPDTPYDMAGMRCGGASPAVKAIADAMGMSFIMVAMPERYTAMERGMVDTFSMPLNSAASWKMYEVCKYVVEHQFYRENAVFLLNLDTWNKLPKNLQTLILDTYAATEAENVRLRTADMQSAKKKFTDAKVEFVKFSPADAKWFVDEITKRESERMKQLYPDIASRLMPLLQK